MPDPSPAEERKDSVTRRAIITGSIIVLFIAVLISIPIVMTLDLKDMEEIKKDRAVNYFKDSFDSMKSMDPTLKKVLDKDSVRINKIKKEHGYYFVTYSTNLGIVTLITKSNVFNYRGLG